MYTIIAKIRAKIRLGEGIFHVCLYIIILSMVMIRSAMEHFDEQKSERLKTKTDVIELKRNLLACKEDKLATVQETVKSDITNFINIVEKNCSPLGSSVTPENLKKVVKSVFADGEGQRNMMIFGAGEEFACKGEKLNDRDLVDNLTM